MDGWTETLSLLPERRREALRVWREKPVEELRLRCGRAPTLLLRGRERPFDERPCDEEELQAILEKACGASLHAVSEALAAGYLSAGGVRIGICGSALLRGGEPAGFREIGSLALRIPHEYHGIAGELPELMLRKGLADTLILSPPGGGKTTLLRELLRCLSERGVRIAVADERNELSASDGARAHFDLGPCSDVLIGVPRARGAMLLLRSMNPQLIAMDEISAPEDLEAARRIAGCGVVLLATAHAAGVSDLRRRPLYRALLKERLFRYAIVIRQERGRRSYALEELTP